MAYKPQILAVTEGGTGLSSATSQGIFYATAANTIGQLAAPVQTGTVEYFNANVVVATASNRFRFYNDFIDTAPLQFNTSGSGTTTTNANALDSGHAGIFEMGTGATATAGSSAVPSCGIKQIILGGGNVFYETCVNIPVLSTGAQTFQVYVGLHDGWVFINPPANGIYFAYLQATSANWIIKSSNGGTTTSTTSSTAVATGWTRLGILYSLSGTTATFYVNGISIGTINTNIPTNGISPIWTIYKTVGSTNINFYVDYLDLTIDFTTPR